MRMADGAAIVNRGVVAPLHILTSISLDGRCSIYCEGVPVLRTAVNVARMMRIDLQRERGSR